MEKPPKRESRENRPDNQIVLIEDDKSVLASYNLYIGRFEKMGFEVIVLENVADAIAHFTPENLAKNFCTIMDFNLPDGNSMEILEHISKLPQIEDMPFRFILNSAEQANNITMRDFAEKNNMDANPNGNSPKNCKGTLNLINTFLS